MPENAVAFVVPIYNRWNLAAPMLESLRPTTIGATDTGYYVVDDGSCDDTRMRIASLPAPFRVIRHDRNLGFGPSLNRAISSIDARLIVLLNSDLILEPGWYEPMLEAIESLPAAFAVGNVQHAAHNTEAIDHAGIVFHEEGHPVHFRASPDFIQRSATREFPAVTAACCMIRRERFLALGGFDERFRNGFEDVDLCLRARMRGWPSFVANRSRVGHHISASPGRKDHEEANARLFLERWRPLTSVWQRDWDNRLLRERRMQEDGVPCAAPPFPTDRNRIRVFVDLARLAPGGSNGGVKVLVRELLAGLHTTAPQVFSVLLVVPHSVETEAATWTIDGDEVWTLPDGEQNLQPPPPRVHRLKTADASLARCLDAEVVYCPLGVSDYLTPDIPSIGVAVDVLHRDCPELLPAREVAARETWFDLMVHTSFRIQCNSQWVAARLRHHFGVTLESTFVVYNAVHTRLGSLPTRPVDVTPIFLYPANAWPHKNHATLLVAYQIYLLSAGAEAWPLVLTGHPDAAMARLVAHARALGIEEKVSFPGFVSDEVFKGLWARAGAMVFPSLYEGFGIPLVEAMHFGVPVVAADLGSTHEVARDACLYVDMRDPRALAQALDTISTDETLRATLIERGRIQVRQFSFSNATDRLASTFREAVAAFRSAGITWRSDAS